MNEKLVKSVLILLFLHSCIAFTIRAQSVDVAMTDIAGFKNKLELSSENTKTIDCDFVQEKSSSMLTRKISSKGHFWFKKPGYIRWEYTNPYYYLIIIAKKKVLTKEDGSKKQYDTQSNTMFKELGAMMFNFVQGNITACEKDYITIYTENDKSYYVKLIPKSAKVQGMLSQVDLYFDKKDLSVSKIKMLEPGGDYTLIEFWNKKLNMDISDTVFSTK